MATPPLHSNPRRRGVAVLPVSPMPTPPLRDATHLLAGGGDSGGAGGASPSAAILWENLSKLPPTVITHALGRPPLPQSEVLGAVWCSAGPFPLNFGSIDVATAAVGGAAMGLSVLNTGVQPVRVTDVVLRPANVPFRAVHRELGAVLRCNDSFQVSVVVDMKAHLARGETKPWTGGLVQFWCVVAVDCLAVPATVPSTWWSLQGRCVGAELRADISSWAQTAREIKLNADAPPFVPLRFKRCFMQEGRASLPAIVDEGMADALVPRGMRRIVRNVTAVHLACPSRAARESGELGCLHENISHTQEVEEDRTDDENFLEGSAMWGPELESLDSYKRRLSLGLHLEVEKSFSDIKRYDMFETPLEPASRMDSLYVWIHVPGLSEARPALVLFDPVRIRPAHVAMFATTELIGRVTRIDGANSRIIVKLPQAAVHHSTLYGILEKARNGTGPCLRVCVRFCVGHTFTAFSLMQEVVQTLRPNLFNRLMRAPPLVQAVPLSSRAQWVRQLSFAPSDAAILLGDLNTPQLEAVFMSVGVAEEGVDPSFPVLIYGPPGCGKTRTLTAAILVALLKRGLDARILAVAPSHQAADVLCERLSDGLDDLWKAGKFGRTPRATMLRLNPYEREVNTARVSTIEHTFQSGERGFFELPPLEQLQSFNVIVSTCASVGLMAELPASHFNGGVFCDESAQSLQPEALIPLSRFARDPNVRIVLAGDPHQLNAEVSSAGAARLGLHMSLIEELMRARKQLPGNSFYDVHLRVNYRVRHPALLELPNKLFYEDRLITRPDLKPLKPIDGLESLFPSGIPILFAGLSCPESRMSASTPGLKNVGEAVKITALCKQITGIAGNGRPAVRPENITVICPYRAQVAAVRFLLRKERLDSVKVGTVFDTQGQQNGVVIVSLTVSSEESMGLEESRREGITAPKKFNVAVTRACELLIVVGNPSVFRKNPYWGTLLRYAVRNGCYAGVRFEGIEDIRVEPEAGDMEKGSGDERNGTRLYSLFPTDRVRQNLLVTTDSTARDYDQAMEELDARSQGDEQDYEVDLEELEASFREEDDIGGRFML